MSMHNTDGVLEPHEPRTQRNETRSDDIFDAALLRLSQRRSTPRTGPAPAEDIKALTGTANPVNKYLANRNARPETMRRYEDKLKRAAALLREAGFDGGDDISSTREFPWHAISVADADALTRLLAKRYTSAKSRENVLGVVRSVLRQCVRAELLDRRTYDGLLEALPVRSSETNVTGREISDDELLALQRAAMSNPNPVLAARNSAVLAVFISTGCRISEVADLDVSDYRLEDRSLMLRVTKSNRPVRVWLNDWAAEQLDIWLAVRGVDSGPMFTSITGTRLTTSGHGDIVSKAVADAGITRRTTSHDFRRTFITRLLRADVDPFTVRRLVNHKNVTTTMIYDRRTELEDRRAVQRLELPDPRRCRPADGDARREERDK